MIDINSNDKSNRVYNEIQKCISEGNEVRVYDILNEIEDGVINYLDYLIPKYCKSKNSDSFSNIPIQELYNLLLRSRPITKILVSTSDLVKNLDKDNSNILLNVIKYIISYMDKINSPLKPKLIALSDRYPNYGSFYVHNTSLKINCTDTESIAVNTYDKSIQLNVICNSLNLDTFTPELLNTFIRHEIAHLDTPKITKKFHKTMNRISTDSSHSSRYLQKLEGMVDEHGFRSLSNRDVKNAYRLLNNLYLSTGGSGLSKTEPGRISGYRRARFKSGFLGRDRDCLRINKGLHPIKRFKSGMKAYRVAVENTSNFSQLVYDPPLPFSKLPMSLRSDKLHAWRAKTGIELIHKEPTYEEFKRICRNWELMPDRLKIISDKKSIELFGKDNKSRMKILESEYN